MGSLWLPKVPCWHVGPDLADLAHKRQCHGQNLSSAPSSQSTGRCRALGMGVLEKGPLEFREV